MFFNTNFEFNGESSEQKFGLKLVRLNGGMVEQVFAGSKKVAEQDSDNWDKPTFYGTKSAPLSFSITLAKEEEWSFEERMEVARWLNKDEYSDFRPGDYPIVFKVISVGQPKFYNNGFGHGYLEMEFRCDGPYAYSNKSEVFLNLDGNGVEGFTYEMDSLSNIGKVYKPEVQVEMVSGETSFSIENKTNGSKIEMTGLDTDEIIYIDCNKEVIISSKSANRIPNLTDLELLYLSYGVNKLLIKGQIKLTIRAQYPIII